MPRERSEEVAYGLLVVGGKAPVLFGLGPKLLDQVAFFVPVRVDILRRGPVLPARDHGVTTTGPDRVHEFLLAVPLSPTTIRGASNRPDP